MRVGGEPPSTPRRATTPTSNPDCADAPDADAADANAPDPNASDNRRYTRAGTPIAGEISAVPCRS
ncbi:hypothetical protein [Gordonia paraffinivorans]|uniref:hypothetical protein n=1 Tax=Gordonia paraffinivorans TaxID=175628 RepID=UPI001FFA0CC7|nr:hypothetical protein [Gordonia paraffinivorans]